MINPEIKRLADFNCSDVYYSYNRFNETDYTPRIERLVGELLKKTKQKNFPSIDIYSIFELAYIKKITFGKCIGDGTLRLIKDGFEIEVNKTLSYEEQRMAIAHEIGHTLFHDFNHEEERPQRKLPIFDPFNKNEEVFCEMFAQELLMPSSLLKNVAKNFPTPNEEKNFKVDYLIKLANLFEVPEESMAEKLVRENIWKEAIIFQLGWNEKKDLDFSTFSKNWFIKWIIPHKLPGVMGKECFPLPIPIQSDLEGIANDLFYKKNHKSRYEISQPFIQSEFLQDIFPKEFYDYWEKIYDIKFSSFEGKYLSKSQPTLWSQSPLFVWSNLDQIQLPLWFSSEGPISSKSILKLRQNSAKIIGVAPLP